VMMDDARAAVDTCRMTPATATLPSISSVPSAAARTRAVHASGAARIW
jgi:hypothetical protein